MLSVVSHFTLLLKNAHACEDPCYIHSAKKFMDTYKSPIFIKNASLKSLLCEAGECLLHFDTKPEEIG